MSREALDQVLRALLIAGVIGGVGLAKTVARLEEKVAQLEERTTWLHGPETRR